MPKLTAPKANCFLNGWGVQKDPVAARSYMETAANLGDMDAEQEVARFYLDGIGGPKDKVSGWDVLLWNFDDGSVCPGDFGGRRNALWTKVQRALRRDPVGQQRGVMDFKDEADRRMVSTSIAHRNTCVPLRLTGLARSATRGTYSTVFERCPSHLPCVLATGWACLAVCFEHLPPSRVDWTTGVPDEAG